MLKRRTKSINDVMFSMFPFLSPSATRNWVLAQYSIYFCGREVHFSCWKDMQIEGNAESHNIWRKLVSNRLTGILRSSFYADLRYSVIFRYVYELLPQVMRTCGLDIIDEILSFTCIYICICITQRHCLRNVYIWTVIVSIGISRASHVIRASIGCI